MVEVKIELPKQASCQAPIEYRNSDWVCIGFNEPRLLFDIFFFFFENIFISFFLEINWS